jgi:hypothetical protein
MQAISVSDPPEGASFNLGELKMLQVHRLGFLSQYIVPFKNCNEFCISVIRLAIENLVLNKIISCSWGVLEKKFWFIKMSSFEDWATCNKSSLENKQFGYLESAFLQLVMNDAENTMADHIGSLFREILPNYKYQNPAKEILTVILTKNQHQFLNYHLKREWLSKNIYIDISESQEDAMVEALNKTCLPIIEERNRNKAFRDFSDRLYKHIDLALHRKTSSGS